MLPLGILVSFGSLLAVGAFAWPTSECPSKAIYLQTNAVVGNSIVAVPIKEDGTLGTGVVYATGGKGWNHVDAMMKPATPDALLSQSSVVVAGNYLFAVNAMSSSVTIFRINSDNATDLYRLGSSAVKGDFPNTIAASTKNRLVCVATTGMLNGVSCATYSSRGLGPFDALRPLGLNQTTPPAGPPNTTSQLSFTEDEKFLVVTVKGIPPANVPGFVAVYRVQGKKLARDAVRSSPANTAVLFGFSQIPRSNQFIVTDPSLGAAILGFDQQSCAVTTVKAVNITGQMATCWSAISPATGTVFVTDGGVNRLVELGVPDGEIVSVTDLSANGDPGLLDIAASGEFLYALGGGTGTVTVFNAKTKKMVQHAGLGSLGVGANAQGMAVFAGW